MKLIFTIAGKFKSSTDTIIVSPEDVEAKKIFEVFATNGVQFVDTGSAKIVGKAKKEKVPKPEEFEPKPEKKSEPKEKK